MWAYSNQDIGWMLGVYGNHSHIGKPVSHTKRETDIFFLKTKTQAKYPRNALTI